MYEPTDRGREKRKNWWKKWCIQETGGNTVVELRANHPSDTVKQSSHILFVRCRWSPPQGLREGTCCWVPLPPSEKGLCVPRRQWSSSWENSSITCLIWQVYTRLFDPSLVSHKPNPRQRLLAVPSLTDVGQPILRFHVLWNLQRNYNGHAKTLDPTFYTKI